MREILFRGKDIAGNWHYGVPLIFTEDYVCITAPHTYNKSVIPDTVGQYTGLTDKNGEKIFEGDILSYIEEIETRSKGKETLKGIYEVKFEYCGFSPLDCLACNHLKIIGNIHDNPELLKGGIE